ncbi:MAG: hypothetical protein IAE65_11240 [Ignavibacteria bacterium]|nr:hypothetical protein [Ignavibacteria bacterium]
MKKISLIPYLNYLSPDDISKLRKFANSPYLNSNKQIITFTEFLYRYKNIFKDKIDSKEKIYEIIYGNEKFNDINFRKFISDFKKCFLLFMSTEIFLEDKYQYYTNLIRSFGKKKMIKEIRTILPEFQNFLKSKFAKNSDFYETALKFYDSDYYYNYFISKSDYSESIINLNQTLDYNFCFEKLHHYNLRYNHNISSSQKYDLNISFLNEILKFVNDNLTDIKKNHPNLYLVFLNTNYFLEKGNPDILDEYKNYLFKVSDKFDLKTNHYYFSYLVSLYMYKTNHREYKYRKDIFELYEFMIKKGFYISGDYITDTEFNNVVAIGIALKKFDYVEKFITKFSKHLDNEYSENIVSLNFAKLYTFKNDFSKALEYIQNINKNDPYSYIHSKLLTSKIYFQQNETELISSIENSLSLYFKRNKKVSLEYKEAVDNYFRFLFEIINSKGNKNYLNKLKKNIENFKGNMFYRTWLIDFTER